MNLICVEVDDGHGSFWKALHKANEDANTKHHDIELRELRAGKVAEIIEGLAQEASIAFDADVVREITRRYKEYSQGIATILVGPCPGGVQHFGPVTAPGRCQL
ncbi:MAG TPA: hypothetical protein VF845_10730 [Terriglobales bacterium]